MFSYLISELNGGVAAKAATTTQYNIYIYMIYRVIQIIFGIFKYS